MPATAEVEFPRKFIPADLAFDDWSAIEPWYQQLLDRQITSREDFEQWLYDFSELDAAFDEESTARYIAMSCATDDAEREMAYLHFVENVAPKREPIHHSLRQKLADEAARLDLPAERYEVLLRGVRNALEIFREKNIPLHVELTKLSQQFQKITGAMTVTLDGEELTIQQASRHLEDTDRAKREQVWRLCADRYLTDADALDNLYDEMVKLRHQVARNADCANFREYTFKAYERFDYTPADCIAYHDAIAAVVVPAVNQLAEARKSKLKLDTIRPWDTEVDPDNRPPTRPFENVDELIAGCSDVFHQVDPELGQIFDTLRHRGSLDLDSRKGKAPGGYQATYDERRLPFIFMNAVGRESDVRTLLHEGGHAFHTWSCRNDPLKPYRSYPIEFAEVASMGMECLSLPHMKRFYGDETPRAERRFFEKIVEFLPYMAMVDALQHFVYTNVDATAADRAAEWVRLGERFMPHIDRTGLEQYARRSWQRKLHFFEVPFYYIEYGIAQLGALQVWLNSRKDYAQAVNLYRNGLTLGGSRPLPELFTAAGCKFDFSEKTVRPLIDAVMEHVEGL